MSVVVEVMPKPEILDPQGQAVLRALHRLGFTQVAGVRQGKRFELEVEGEVDDAALAAIEQAAATLLANPVIEEHTVHVGQPVHDEVSAPSPSLAETSAESA